MICPGHLTPWALPTSPVGFTQAVRGASGWAFHGFSVMYRKDHAAVTRRHECRRNSLTGANFAFRIGPPVRLTLGSPGDSAFGGVIDGYFHRNLITGQDLDIIHSELAGNMGRHDHVVRELYFERSVRQCFHDRTLEFNYVILRQIVSPPIYAVFGLCAGRFLLCPFAGLHT